MPFHGIKAGFLLRPSETTHEGSDVHGESEFRAMQ